MPQTSTSLAINHGFAGEAHSDTGSGTYAERISYGSTSVFQIRASAASGLTTGYSTASADFVTPPWARGITLFASIDAVASNTSGAASITYTLQPKDTTAGNYITGGVPSSAGWTFDSSGSGTSQGTTGGARFAIYPGIEKSTGVQYSGVLPGTWRLNSVLSGSSMNWTWQVNGQFEP